MKIDELVRDKKFKNRSQAIKIAVQQAVERLEHTRLADECQKLDILAEQKWAEEAFDEDIRMFQKNPGSKLARFAPCLL